MSEGISSAGLAEPIGEPDASGSDLDVLRRAKKKKIKPHGLLVLVS